jgi:hypothetical protein
MLDGVPDQPAALRDAVAGPDLGVCLSHRVPGPHDQDPAGGQGLHDETRKDVGTWTRTAGGPLPWWLVTRTPGWPSLAGHAAQAAPSKPTPAATGGGGPAR